MKWPVARTTHQDVLKSDSVITRMVSAQTTRPSYEVAASSSFANNMKLKITFEIWKTKNPEI